ncbi:insulin-like growth factor binding protein [Anaeramoeba flamelloides]|uniref:Insulin-like growth factor binding protein n=1 Tax=Anaeramoeba flamelloides TaxID=1746091 RepID=A0ABQ8Z2Q2_9EUKA|nr:insulin-like growth factor binding protein [Anaeramoeba flamelloides]
MFIENSNFSQISAFDKLSSKTNYFFDTKRITSVPNYSGIKYSNIFEGVDLIFETGKAKIKSIFELDLGHKISKIKWNFKFSKNLKINISKQNGNLQFHSRLTNKLIFEESNPIFFQNNLQLKGNFILNPNLNGNKKENQKGKQKEKEYYVMFHINDPNFDKNQFLIIDPTYSTYLGWNGRDEVQDAVFDSEGCIIGAGNSNSRERKGNFSFTSNDESNFDAIVFKLCSGNDLVWYLYLSSNLPDVVKAIILDSNENIYIGGYTDGYQVGNRNDAFPTTKGAYRENCTQYVDGQGITFLSKISNNGEELLYSTVVCCLEHNFPNSLGLSSDETTLYFGGNTLKTLPSDGQNGDNIDCIVERKSGYYASISSDLSDLQYLKCPDFTKDETESGINDVYLRDGYLYFGGSIVGLWNITYQDTNCTHQRDKYDESHSFLYGRVNASDFTKDFICAFGGSDFDKNLRMNLDSQDNIWIVGESTSTDILISTDALISTRGTISKVGIIAKFDGPKHIYSTWFYNEEKNVDCSVYNIAFDENDQIIISVNNYQADESQYDYSYGSNGIIQIFNEYLNQTYLTIQSPDSEGDETQVLIVNEKNDHHFALLVFNSDEELKYTTKNAFQNSSAGNEDIQVISFDWDCGPGNYTTRDGFSPCKTGTYNDENYIANECKDCLVGTYQDEEGKSICKECSYGSYQPTTGKTYCRECGIGTFGNETKLQKCFDCDKGTYSNIEGLSRCLDCGPGLYSVKPKSTSCKKCPMGKFSNKTSNFECDECQFGTYSDTAGNSKCWKCLVGSYQNLRGQTNCTHCPEGTYSNSKGSSLCDKCSKGTYQPNTRSSKCLQCGIGHYQDEEGSTGCKKCDDGEISSERGQAFCVPCGNGTYANELQTECLLCPMGTYNDQTGQSSIEGCEPCPLLTYSSIVGSKSIDGCVPCQEGYWSETEGGVAESVCIPCSKGTFLDPKEKTKKCQTCEFGSYADQEALTSCLLCPEGTTSSKNFHSCDSCESGTYAEGAGNSRCKKCPSGTYNNQTQQTSCLKCVHEEYCIGGDQCSSGRNPETICEICLNGYFELNKSCQECPSNLQYIYLLIVIIVVIAFLSIFRKRVQRTILEDPYPIYRIVITFVQLLSSLFTLNLSWPDSIKGTFSKWGSLFVFSFDTVASPDCFAEMDWYSKWIFQFVTPLITLSALALIYFSSKCYFNKKKQAENQEDLNIFFSRLISLTLKYFFIPMSNISFQPFSYTKNPDTNESVLSIDPSISTSDDKYKRYLILFILSILIYIVGIPLFFVIVLIKAKKNNFNKYWYDRFGWIFLNYKSNRYWFEMIEILIKFLLALSAIIFLNDEKGINQRNYFLFGLFIFATVLVIYLKPYRFDATLDHGKFSAEDRAQIGLYLMIIGAISLALGYFKSIVFIIIWPFGAIIGFVGLYYSYLKTKQIKIQVNLKFASKVEIKKNQKMLKRLTKKQTISDLHLLALNQQLVMSLKESQKIQKQLLSQIKQLDDKISTVGEENVEFDNVNNKLFDENDELKVELDK